ncbi:VWA domain-containing protein [Flavobacteriaceae bacterium S356]|uniref:VWA domain-containing protein n=1 Tax=Asprobacillus argus TaxID=3076534 RepID=A0ABU3LDU5_9FLAO|nr:VWA domain-containing protein [Flavobacteriaceae bacterium S356]
MNSSSFFFVIIALVLALCIAYFQYFYKSKDRRPLIFALFGLRSASIFLILLLFFNPTIKKTELQTNKPVLAVLVDNSQSSEYFNEQQEISRLVGKFKSDQLLNDKFTLSFFSFGNSFQTLDSLTFLEPQTNINQAIESVNTVYKEAISPIVLITDGNQTLGNDYEYSSTSKQIYPLIIGDTVKHKDLRVSQLNVNKYSYLGNSFPVEALLYYEGNQSISSEFVIHKNGKRVFSKKISFSNDKRSITVETSLPSSQKGKNYYTASIKPISDEKNIANNTKNFSVEVIDEQTKIGIITSVLHPDIGAIKKSIETNKQRKVAIKVINNDIFKTTDYQLVIMYQPNSLFNKLIAEIKKEKSNYLIITGSKTDWSFVNSLQLGISKNAISKDENYLANFNQNFLTFGQSDIGFEQFSPLQDKFGEITVSKPFEPILYQNINGISLNVPLLAMLEENNQKSAFLLGEGIWKWRATSYLNSNSFTDFDSFVSNVVQYLASTKARKRLDVTMDPIFPSNATIDITAFYVDSNYKFDDRATITMELSSTENTIKRELPFSVIGNAYQLNIEDLPAGDYTYKVSVKDQNISSNGTFRVTTFNVEEQFTSTNTEKLNRLADRTGGESFYKTKFQDLKKSLLENTDYFTTQKTITKDKNIIDWYWVLLIALFLLTVEWFIRKYYGKI